MYKNQILMDGISNMIFVVNVEERDKYVYEFLNRVAMQKTGLTHSVIGKTFDEVHPQEVARFLVNQYSKVVLQKSSYTYEDTYNSLTEELLYSRTILTPLFNEEKKCIQIVAEVMDITQQKEEEYAKSRLWRKLKESNQRYQSLFQYNQEAVVSMDLNGEILDCNVMAEKVTGYSETELIGTLFEDLVISGDANLLEKLFLNAVEGSANNSLLNMVTKLNSKIIITLKVVPILVDFKVLGIYGIFRDVTKEREFEQKLKEREERLRIITENASDLITLIDENGIIIYASPSYKSILGKEYREYIGKHYLHNVFQEDKKKVAKKIEKSIQDRKKFQLQFRQFISNGEVIWCEGDGTPIFDEQGMLKHVVVISRNINKQKEYETKLKFFALHDSLTGLPNRRYFNDELEQSILEYQRNHDGLAVIMLDLDNFKRINDHYGHDIGDGVIVEFGKRISHVINKIGFAARLGGDEFVILLPGVGEKEKAIEISERIKKEMKKPWNVTGQKINPTTSMGIALANQEISSYSILKNADLALYEAKKSGKNSIYVWRNRGTGPLFH
jgi:diguanylate cyclase (GGDEF)-like protein/PAS domain S-box-containing protein